MTSRKAQSKKKKLLYHQEEVQTEDPLVAVRRLEAQLAQEKFFHDKTCAEQQHEIKTLQAKVKNLERLKKTLQDKLDQNPNEEQEKVQREANNTGKLLKETTRKLTTCQQQVEKLLRSNRGLKKAKDKLAEQMMDAIEIKDIKIKKLEETIKRLKKQQNNGQGPTKSTTKRNSEKIDRVMEMWDESDDEKRQDEEKCRKETRKKLHDAVEALEEKDTQELLSFFPFMYENDGKEHGNKTKQDQQKTSIKSSKQEDFHGDVSLLTSEASPEVHDHMLPQSPASKTVDNRENKSNEGRENIVEKPGYCRQDICHFYEAMASSGESKNVRSLEKDYEQRKNTCEANDLNFSAENTASFLSTLVITHHPENEGNQTAQTDYNSSLNNVDANISFGAKLNMANEIIGQGIPLNASRYMSPMEGRSKRPPPGLNIFEPNPAMNEFDFFNDSYNSSSFSGTSLYSSEQKSACAATSWEPAVKMASVKKLTPTKAR